MSAGETNVRSVDDPDADIDHDDKWILPVKGVGKRFSGLQVLNDVDVTVNRGEIIDLIGPNSAGKTAPFSCINGAFLSTGGTIRLGGEVISSFPTHKIARARLTRTFRVTCPLEELTAIENTVVGAHIHTRHRNKACEIVMKNLKFVGFTDKAEEETGELTVGVQERLELARAASTRPEILLLDETMAGLTSSKSNRILDLFRQLHEHGASLLIIEHDMKAVVSISDYVKMLDQGENVAFGAPKAVVEDNHIIEVHIGGLDAGA